MTAIVYSVTDEQALVMTDTLASSRAREPLHSIDKCELVPHLNLAVVSLGWDGLRQQWLRLLRSSAAPACVDELDEETPKALRVLWAQSGESSAADRACLFQFGVTADGTCRGYSYDSTEDFEPRRLGSEVGVAPASRRAYPDVSTLDGWVRVVEQLRQEGKEDREAGRDGAVIGGDVMLTIVRPGSLVVERVHRFEDDVRHGAGATKVFAYPGTAWLSEKLLGAPIPLEGRVAGLSLMTEVLPGVGPVVQIPAGRLLPETPSWDWVRETLMPFGEPDVDDEGFIESMFPAWVKKLKTSGLVAGVPLMAPTGDMERLLNNTAFDLYAWEVSAGKRPRAESIEEIQAALEDNMDRARWLYLIRAGAQFGAPAAPTPAMVAMDKDGRVQIAQRLRDDYYALQQEDPNTAFLRFMDKYGEAAFLVVQPKSQALTYGAPVTTDGVRFEREHPDLAERYRNTFGLFAPTSGDFDFEAYSRQFRTGRRQALTPEQAVLAANARLASAMYGLVRDQVGVRPTREQQAWLREVREALTREYPGFGDVPGIAEKAKLDTAVAELTRALDEPALADTDAGRGLTKYLRARQMAQASAEAAGLASYKSAAAMAPARDWLRQVAQAVLRENPGFASMWSQVFERELAEDEPEQEAPA